MKLVKTFFNAVITACFIALLTVSLASPTLASNLDTKNISYSAVDEKNEIQQAIILEKLVCRYIDGHKRCWHE